VADAVPHFNGMFAIAVWDRDLRRLSLVRDRLGIKPLYLSETPARVRFASSLPALLEGGDVDTSIDRVALHHYMTFHSVVPAPRTILAGVRKLPPATVRTIRPDGSGEEHAYWRPEHVRREQDRGMSARDWRDAVLEALRVAVRRRMVADVPVGVLLSGGLDSSLVVALLADEGQVGLKTFSVGFHATGGESGDEFEYSDLIAERFGTDHQQILVDPHRMLPAVDAAITAMAEPMVSHDCVAFYLLSEEVAKSVKVVQSGQGADEVFAGYGRYRRNPLQRWAKSLVAPGSGGFRTRSYWRHRWVREVFGPELRVASEARRAPFIAAWQEAPRCWSHLARSQYVDLTTYLVDDLLVKVDRVLMGFGVEGRVPFLDQRVVEFGLALPDSLKIGGRHGKLILRRWAERRLPREYVGRRKRGFFVPIRQWFRGDFLNQLVTVLPWNAAIRRWFRPEGVAALVREQQAGGNVSRAIWGLLQIAIWHRVFIEGRTPSRDEDPLDWIA
jgi:asparagine synthase (glutamine-hydrolysing)